MANTTPRSLGSNMPNNLVESHVGSSRDAIKADLLEKIVYDDPAVFKRLRVDQVDSNFVAMCAASFKTVNTEDIDILVKLAEKGHPMPKCQQDKRVNPVVRRSVYYGK